MKKIMMVVVGLFFVAGVLTAQAQISLGLHGAYSSGGTIENSAFGFGGQMIVPFTELMSLEISATKFADEVEVTKVEITHVAATLRLSTLVGSDKLKVSGGIGVSYNSFGVSIDSPGITADIEDTFGGHVAVGASTKLSGNAELFAEYRYSVIKTAAEIRNQQCRKTVRGDFNFGLLRVGIGWQI